jgi:hypothetical protein
MYFWFTFRSIAEILLFKATMTSTDVQKDFSAFIRHEMLNFKTDVKFYWALSKQGSHLAGMGSVGLR